MPGFCFYTPPLRRTGTTGSLFEGLTPLPHCHILWSRLHFLTKQRLLHRRHVGGAYSSNEILNGLVTGNNHSARLLGGVQAGADYQFGSSWVVGVEGQYSWLGSGNSGIALRALLTGVGSALRKRPALCRPFCVGTG